MDGDTLRTSSGGVEVVRHTREGKDSLPKELRACLGYDAYYREWLDIKVGDDSTAWDLIHAGALRVKWEKGMCRVWQFVYLNPESYAKIRELMKQSGFQRANEPMLPTNLENLYAAATAVNSMSLGRNWMHFLKRMDQPTFLAWRAGDGSFEKGATRPRSLHDAPDQFAH